MKRLINHSLSGEETAGSIIIDVERLREPMQKITNFFRDQATADIGEQIQISLNK